MLLVKAGGQWKKYFISRYSLLTNGFFGGLFVSFSNLITFIEITTFFLNTSVISTWSTDVCLILDVSFISTI